MDCAIAVQQVQRFLDYLASKLWKCILCFSAWFLGQCKEKGLRMVGNFHYCFNATVVSPKRAFFHTIHLQAIPGGNEHSLELVCVSFSAASLYERCSWRSVVKTGKSGHIGDIIQNQTHNQLHLVYQDQPMQVSAVETTIPTVRHSKINCHK